MECGDTLSLILGGVSAFIGLLVGIFGWGETVPPRWFWVKSATELAGNRVVTALQYAFQFFFIPPTVMGLIEYFG